MAEALFLVTRTDQGVNDDRNLVREVILADDDATTDADVIIAAVAVMNAAFPAETGAPDTYKAGYFDTVNELSDLVTSSILRTDGNFIAFAPRVGALVDVAA